MDLRVYVALPISIRADKGEGDVVPTEDEAEVEVVVVTITALAFLDLVVEAILHRIIMTFLTSQQKLRYIHLRYTVI